MTNGEAFSDCRGVEYRELMTRLAELVGRHQLPIRPDATDINEILDGDPVHYELVRDVVRSIYRSSGCGHLDATVRMEAVFNSLGGIRGRLVAGGETDIDQINFLEELGWASRIVFSTALPTDAGTEPEPDADNDRPVVLQYPSH
ncbi:MAG: hypothetical protein WAL83_04530 [Arenicellales bacterium]